MFAPIFFNKKSISCLDFKFIEIKDEKKMIIEKKEKEMR